MFYERPRARLRAHIPRFHLKLLAVLGVAVLMVTPLIVPSADVSAKQKMLALAQAGQQSLERELDTPEKVDLVINNSYGRVILIASDEQKKVLIRAESPAGSAPVTEKDVVVEVKEGRVAIKVERGRVESSTGGTSATPSVGSTSDRGDDVFSSSQQKRKAERERLDLTVRVPVRARVKVATGEGAVDVVGNVESAEVVTDTGTIRADVPLDALKYRFQWIASRPRFYSEVELPEVKERRGGVYEIEGRFGDKKAKREERIELNLVTERGVILFGVSDTAMVPADLRARALTEAARAIIRSGHLSLIEAIRKVAPRLVGEYAETLPARLREPSLIATRRAPGNIATRVQANLVRFNARVTDRHGRAIGGLTEKDFQVFENGEVRAVQQVAPSSTPFNIILLLDVSGSVEERLDFIRKAALAFVNTVSRQDRLAIISFRDDIQIISEFTTDRAHLTTSIKKIEAGGATALYDALAYALVHTLKPLRGERTGIVMLSDGDDNRSFIPFPSVIEATVESGALIYPLYIPSGLIPTASTPVPSITLDPMRTRYLTVTSRAHEEGRKLAEVSGGVYYPITRLDQLQKAYDDVVAQLRASYTITYTSQASERSDRPSAAQRLRVKVAREDAAVSLSPAVGVNASTITITP